MKYTQTIGSGIMKSPAIKVRILNEKLLDETMWKLFQRGYDENDVSWFLQHLIMSFCQAVKRDGPPDMRAGSSEFPQPNINLLILHGDTRRVTVIQQKEVA